MRKNRNTPPHTVCLSCQTFWSFSTQEEEEEAAVEATGTTKDRRKRAATLFFPLQHKMNKHLHGVNQGMEAKRLQPLMFVMNSLVEMTADEHFISVSGHRSCIALLSSFNHVSRCCCCPAASHIHTFREREPESRVGETSSP